MIESPIKMMLSDGWLNMPIFLRTQKLKGLKIQKILITKKAPLTNLESRIFLAFPFKNMPRSQRPKANRRCCHDSKKNDLFKLVPEHHPSVAFSDL